MLTASEARDIPSELRRVFRSNGKPVVRINACGTTAAVLEWTTACALKDLTEPSVSLFDGRLNPRNSAPHPSWMGPVVPRTFKALTFVTLKTGDERQVQLPAHSGVVPVGFAPDDSLFALATIHPRGVTLWVATVSDGSVRALIRNRVSGARLLVSRVIAKWTAVGDLLVPLIVTGSGRPRRQIARPTCFDEQGKGRHAAKHPDGLWLPSEDQYNLQTYFMSQLVLVDVRTRETRPIGPRALIDDFDPSPDCRRLLVSLFVPPVPCLAPLARCPRRHEIWTTCAEQNAEQRTAAHMGDQTQRVQVLDHERSSGRWHPTEADTLVWLARGSPNATGSAPAGDAVMTMRGDEPARPLFRGKGFVAACRWTQLGTAIVVEAPEAGGDPTVFVIDASRTVSLRVGSDHPMVVGEALTATGEATGTLLEADGSIYVYTRQERVGARVHKIDLADMSCKETILGTKTLRAMPVAAIRYLGGVRFITVAESAGMSPRLQVCREGTTRRKTINVFRGMRSPLSTIGRMRLAYSRRDGLPLAANIFLPPAYNFRTRLPAAFVVYPLNVTEDRHLSFEGEFHNQFLSSVGIWGLFLHLAIAGYAVIWDTVTATPLTGRLDEYYDTYISQILDDAAAAIDAAVGCGVADRERIGVVGNCRGGSAVAHLLAHSRLFKAGIALNGLYNQVRRPFASDDKSKFPRDTSELYRAESVFEHAAAVREPLMIVQGDADPDDRVANAKMLFTALRANAVTARYVRLPLEGHAFRARETRWCVAHLMREWFDTHVKRAGNT